MSSRLSGPLGAAPAGGEEGPWRQLPASPAAVERVASAASERAENPVRTGVMRRLAVGRAGARIAEGVGPREPSDSIAGAWPAWLSRHADTRLNLEAAISDGFDAPP